MLKLSFFSNFYKKFFSFIFLLLVFFMPGCTSKYYLDKRLDNFYILENDKYSIYSNPNLTYNDFIRANLKEHLNLLPIEYVNCYSTYIVYFNYKKRYFCLPVFRLTIIKNNPHFKEEDEVVYDSLVYSYNSNELKSLLASLMIVTNDLLYKTYTKSKFVKVTSKELVDFSNYKPKKNTEELNNKNLPKRKVIYRLYTNKDLYNQ